MMTRKYLWMLLSFAFLLLNACQKAPELTLTGPSSAELSADGSSATITFTANRDWRVNCSDSWISVSPSSGTAADGQISVTIRSNANTTYNDRSATITITMEELSQIITVRQPANLGIVLPVQSFDLQADAKSIEIEVQANVQYIVSTSVDWIKQSGTKALTSKTLTFNIKENTTYEAREGTITIKPQQGNEPEKVITVRQAQKDALIVEKTSYDLPYGGGQVEIKVEANVAFDVKPDAEWIHYTQTKALSNSTVCLTIDENNTFSPREGKVEIVQQNGSLKHTVTIKQAGRIAVTSVELDKTELTLKPEETATLVATVKPDKATDKTVTWTSSAAEIATVDETGKVTAIKDGSATITAQAGEKTAACSVTVSSSIYVGNAVDMGIVRKRADGTFYNLNWADCNLGTDTPEEYGDYYAWGETEVKQDYSMSTYKFWVSGNKDNVVFSKYITKDSYGTIDEITILQPEDDAVQKKLGEGWRMPTLAELHLLGQQCTWSFITRNGVAGYEVKSKVNGNSIFLPAAGYRSGTGLSEAGTNGYYWTSCLDDYSNQYALTIKLNEILNQTGVWNGIQRFNGLTIRPVLETTIPAISVELNKTSLNMQVGDSESLVATVKPDNTTDKTVTWTSSDASIASVDENGKVTAIKDGSATITAKAGEKTAECKVTVFTPITSIELNKTSLKMKAGDTETLVATIKPDNATNKTVTWTSSAPEIATVDANGTVTAVKDGSATITAQAGSKSATCTVAVKTPVYVGNAVDLGIIITREDGTAYILQWADSNLGTDKPEEYGEYYAWGETETKDNYTWETYKFRTSGDNYDNVKFSKYNTSSSYGPVDNKTVLDPEDDVAHVKLGGKWRMPTKAEQDDLRSQCTWIWTTKNGVNGYEVKSKVNSNSIFLPAAGYRVVTYLYYTGSNGFYWSSSLDTSDPFYAYSVDFNSDNVDWYYSYRHLGRSVRPVLEVEIPITSITLNKSSISLNVGDTIQLQASLSPENATNQSLNWASSDPSVASVSDGKVQALKVGETTITAKTVNNLTATCLIKVERNNPDAGGSEGTGEINW